MINDLIKSPNRWSCLPCSFAMCCGVSLTPFLDRLGHDGSEIKWPDLGEPRQRRAFHIQECIRVCLGYGLRVVPIEFRPRATADGTRFYSIDNSDFANQFMQDCTGVLTGKGQQHFHAVAWNGYKVYDPAGAIYDLPSHIFTPSIFWAVI